MDAYNEKSLKNGRINLNEGTTNLYSRLKDVIEWSDKITSYIDDNGYTRASLSYRFYRPHWIRDASFTALSLMEVARLIKDDKFLDEINIPDKLRKEIKEKSLNYERYASKIIDFNLNILENFKDDVKRFLDSSFENLPYNVVNYNIPARVGSDAKLYRDELMDDSRYANSFSGLVQNDSVPLIMITLEYKADSIGLNEKEISFLKENADTIFNFLTKSVRVQSANAWEIRSDMQHSYDIASIYKAMASLERISKKYDLGFDSLKVNKLLESDRFSNPLAYLKKLFIDSDILYASRMPFSEKPNIDLGVDMSELIVFTLFGINDEVLETENVEKKTVQEIEKDLFNGKLMAKRFKYDSYFFGGRWIISAAEKGLYLIKEGKLEEAESILEKLTKGYYEGWDKVDEKATRIIGEYKTNSFPEQIIYDPESPYSEDNDYFKNNGNSVIQDLMWSYADVARFASTLMREKLKNKEISRSIRK